MRCIQLPFSLLLVSSLIGVAQAASFDCSKASTLTEKAICSDQELSSFDEQVSAAYKIAMQSGVINAQSIKTSQRDWLKTQRNVCMDVVCLKETYRSRLAALSNSAVASGSQPSLSKALLVLEPDAESTHYPADIKTKAVELTGTIGSFHDAAGGNFALVVGKKEYTIRYVGFLSDEQSDTLSNLEDNHRKVTVKGTLVIFKDGTTTFSDQAKIAIY